VTRAIADDGSEAGPAAVAAGQAVVDSAASLPATESDQPSAEVAGTRGSADLPIPLDITDTTFGDNAEITNASPGPGSRTFCGNVPDTTGLIDWNSRVISTDRGLRTLFQIVSRFETPDQAEAYLDAYASTNDCVSWTAPGDDAGEVVYTAQPVAAPVVGDDARRFDITGQIGTTVGSHASVVLIRSGADVLALSLSSVTEAQVTEIDSLAALAAERLGYAN
ncbi:MAG: hypothetical protein AAF547_21535, partial [Actinomycetota bacterium]